ncbi:MAG: tetratricopeptide repeat protein [Hymenobacteraceae bacterium]|nr:tetratricopeptide repeat protein [Hymenobacteraceae bacterium]
MTRNLKYVLLSASVLTAGAASAQTIQQGNKAAELKRYQEAKRIYKQVLKSNPSEEAYYALGDVYVQTEQLDSATIYFNQGIQSARKQRSPLNYAGLGKVALMRNNQAEAQKNFDMALKLSKSKDAKVLAELGEAYLDVAETYPDRNVDLNKAVTYLEDALKRDKDNAEAMLVLGDVYLKQRKGGEAMTKYEQAASANPNNPLPQLRIGQLYTRSRNFTGAEEALKKAVAIDANFAPAYEDLADLYFLAGQYDKALANIKKYTELAENTPETRAKYASFLFLTKDYPGTLREVNQVLQTDPENTVMNRLRAYTMFELGQTDSDLTAMQQFFKRTPSDKLMASDYEYYAKILAKGNQDSLAAINYEMSLKMDTSNTELYNDLANLYMKQKKYDKAIEQYKKKMAKAGESNTDFYYLGRAYMLNDQFVKADSMFALITTSNPDYAFGHLWRAQANANLDLESEKGLAKPHYEEFIRVAETDKDKYKPQLIEANSYLGYYYYLKGDRANAKKYWTEVLTLDPGNEKATTALKEINKSAKRK